jgi:hypothetical protein
MALRNVTSFCIPVEHFLDDHTPVDLRGEATELQSPLSLTEKR